MTIEFNTGGIYLGDARYDPVYAELSQREAADQASGDTWRALTSRNAERLFTQRRLLKPHPTSAQSDPRTPTLTKEPTMTSPLTHTVNIDDGAPVISREEMFIEAPLETVWNLHVDVNAWPSWRSDVDGAQLAGSFGVGSAFHWQTAGMHITSTITQVISGSRTTWGGPADGIDGVHVWEFSPRDNGVLVRTKESWNGEPVHANAPALQSALDESLRVWLRDLRAEAGRHHDTP